MTAITSLGQETGRYESDAIPFWISWVTKIPWLGRKFDKRAITELRVMEHGVVLVRQESKRDTVLRYTEIRRVWFERFTTGSEQKGHTAFRIDLIAENLDTLFSLTKVDCAPDDSDLLLMERLFETWKAENWKHYNVVAAVVRATAQAAGRTDLEANTPVFLCMQRGQTRYAYTAYHWEFPGGKVEDGETEPEALRRELLEEMNYEVKVEEHLTTVEHRYKDFGVTLSCYLCSAPNCDFERREHKEHKWLTPEEMSHLEWCEADAPVLLNLPGIA